MSISQLDRWGIYEVDPVAGPPLSAILPRGNSEDSRHIPIVITDTHLAISAMSVAIEA